MGAGSHSVSCTLGGRSLTRSATTSGENDSLLGGPASPKTLTAGKAVTAWVKDDADTAACVLPSGHGYTSGYFDVYSSAGVIYRYGVTGTVSSNALSLDGGTVPTGGSGFPASESNVIVCKQQQLNVALDGDEASLVGMKATCHAHLNMRDTNSNTIRELTLAAGEPDIWDSDMAVNPYTGEPITNIRISNGSTTDGTFELLISVSAEAWLSPSSSPSASISGTPSTSPSATVSATPSSSPSATVSATPSATVSSTPSATPSSSPSST